MHNWARATPQQPQALPVYPPAVCSSRCACSVGPFLGAIAAAPLHLFFASAYDTRDPLALDARSGRQVGGRGQRMRLDATAPGPL